jgi:ABC-type Fe3+-siderophore transport system permease subunit
MKNLIYWAPRVGSFVFAIFLFALSFTQRWYQPDVDLLTNLKAMVQSNTGAIAILLILLLGWRREHVGAVFMILFALVYSAFNMNEKTGSTLKLLLNQLPVLAPAFIIGILFFFAYAHRMHTSEQDQDQK